MFLFFFQRVLAKETHLHLAQKELNKLREQLANAEITKSQALAELENARKTVEDLNSKLIAIGESKALAIKAEEESQNNMKTLEGTKFTRSDSMPGSWNEDLESSKTSYLAVVSELNDAKQELTKLRHDCDTSLEAKLNAVKQMELAENAAKENMDKSGELSKEISVTRESLERSKLAVIEAHEEHARIFSEKDAQKEVYKTKMEASVLKLQILKQGFNPSLAKDLATEVVNVDKEIKLLKTDMQNAKASELESVKVVTAELDNAKDYLMKVAEEENSLRRSLETLKLELENLKKEHAVMKDKEAEMEFIAGNLNTQLFKTKADLEACIAEESKAREAADKLASSLKQLSVESEKAKRDADEMKLKANELKNEAESTRLALAEAEIKLRVALQEAEEAKIAELKVLDQIKALSERTSAARTSTSDSNPGANITISKDEYDSLSRNVAESDTIADMKVAAALAQVDAIKASENEALKKLESTQQEIQTMKAAISQALKKAEMAESAKRAVEGELRKWREKEQKKAAEAASRILAETNIPTLPSPVHYNVEKIKPSEKFIDVRKLENRPSSVSKKNLLPSLSGMFQRKKSHIDGGSGSPSYHPGEKIV